MIRLFITAFIFISCMLTNLVFAQADDAWIRYWDKKGELSGYKDRKGTVKIPPSFQQFTSADTFYNIIAVTDQAYRYYYLTKSGREVAHDSVYIFDYTYDCENEEKIRFKDYKKDRVGFLDKNGSVIIPAMYNDVTPFYNGVAVALKNAKRKCMEQEDSVNCEHWGWEGGETILIDAKNEILVSNWFKEYRSLNWYSMRINDPAANTGIYVSINGENGKVYSFLSYEKEFEKWFYSVFLPDLASGDTERLKNLLFPEITYWLERKEWKAVSEESFLKKQLSQLKHRLANYQKDSSIFIIKNDLNSFMFNGKKYAKFYNPCGGHFSERYPVFNVVKSYYTPGNLIDYQDHLEFIRTDTGYQLLCVSLKNSGK